MRTVARLKGVHKRGIICVDFSGIVVMETLIINGGWHLCGRKEERGLTVGFESQAKESIHFLNISLYFSFRGWEKAC
jgi:hypothetical protein